jgi:hypothetical protein
MMGAWRVFMAAALQLILTALFAVRLVVNRSLGMLEPLAMQIEPLVPNLLLKQGPGELGVGKNDDRAVADLVVTRAL